MKIERALIANHKSLLNSGNVDLSPGFNIVTGRNNSGKTSLIEALSPSSWSARPHRNASTPPGTGSVDSTASIRLLTNGQELKELFLKRNERFAIPTLSNEGFPARSWLEFFFSAEKIIVDVTRRPDSWLVENCVVDRQAGGANEALFAFDAAKNMHAQGVQNGWGLFSNAISKLFSENTYLSKAERLAIGKNKIEASTALLPSSSNLSDALHSLYTARRARFDNLVSDMSAIFPNVGAVQMDVTSEEAQVPGTFQNAQFAFVTTRIKLKGAGEDRDDLAFDLSDCGTGIGQVLSLLYIVHSSIHPKTVIIDEPNSFLHPGAARKLMEVLHNFPQHQYIITTHSTETINAIPTASVFLVKWIDGQSKIESMTARAADKSRRILSELDVKLSDVFAADQIIWVEGPTERECFPRVLARMNVIIPAGCRFIPVVSTSEISRNTVKAKTLVDIYQSICSSNAILPPAVAISLDRENFSDEQIRAMTDRFGGLVHYLDRRCVENFTLCPEAIAEVLLSDGFCKDRSELQKNIEAWFGKRACGEEFKAPHTWSGNLDDPNWLKKVDGAKLLSSLFAEITDALHVFNKVKHTPLLIDWMLENRSDDIVDLKNHVLALITHPSSAPR